jgi:peptidoglycan/xylan/chitin deacetylase (PgdA/CDA1 family)
MRHELALKNDADSRAATPTHLAAAQQQQPEDDEEITAGGVFSAAARRRLSGGITLKLPDHDVYPRFASPTRRRAGGGSAGAGGARGVSSATDGGGSVLLEVPTWPGGAPGALALTFDDGTPEQLAALQPLCASLGAPCTLFLAGSFAGSVPWEAVDETLNASNTAERIRAAAANAWVPTPGYAAALAAFRAAGNELGAHTLYHRNACPPPGSAGPAWWSFDDDIDDFDTVMQRALGVWPHDVATFAYPFGDMCDAARDAGRGRFLAMRTTRCDAVDAGRADWATQVRASLQSLLRVVTGTRLHARMCACVLWARSAPDGACCAACIHVPR